MAKEKDPKKKVDKKEVKKITKALKAASKHPGGLRGALGLPPASGN